MAMECTPRETKTTEILKCIDLCEYNYAERTAFKIGKAILKMKGDSRFIKNKGFSVLCKH